MYHSVYICEKKGVALELNKRFFNRILLNTIKLTGEKLSSSSFLANSQSSIEVRQILRNSFIKLLLSDYTVYKIFACETFLIFDRLGIK